MEDQPRAQGPVDDAQEAGRPLTLRLNEFTWTAAAEESARLGVSVHELATFALLYYLADIDAGRIAREFPRRADPQS